MKFFLYIIIFTTNCFAQLSQLEFEEKVAKKKKAAVEKNSVNSEKSKKVEIKKKEVKKSSNEKFSYSGKAVNLKPFDDLAFIPPGLKGVATDKKNSNAVTSSISWVLPKSKDCSIGVNETSFLKRGMALKEVLSRFTGNDDYFDASIDNICSEKCEGKEPLLTNLRIDELSSVVLSVGIIKNSCRYLLEKPKKKDWKTIKLLSMTCSCINSSKAKKALGKK